MKIIKTLLIFSLLFSVSCNIAEPLENTFEMTAERAESFGKNPVNFKIDYPNSVTAKFLKDDPNEPNYITFITKDKNASLAIGSLWGTIDVEMMDDALLSSFLDQTEMRYSIANIENYQVSFKGKKAFLDEKLHQLEHSYKFPHPETQKKVTVYEKIVMLNNKDKNGVGLILQAYEGYEEISDASQLGEIGVFARILESFEFTD